MNFELSGHLGQSTRTIHLRTQSYSDEFPGRYKNFDYDPSDTIN